MDRDEFELVSEFKCNGKDMVIIRNKRAAHIITADEWRVIYGRNHQNRWNTKVDWKDYKYEKLKVS